MDRPDGSSVNGASSVKDEPDLGFGNNGFSYKDDCWDLLGHLLADNIEEEFFFKEEEEFFFKEEEEFFNWWDLTSACQISDKIGNLVGKDIFMMSMGDDGGFGSEGTFATHTTGGGNHQSGTDLVTNHKPIVILDTGAEVNVTGDGTLFVPVFYEREGFGLRAVNGNEMKSYWCGFLSHEMYHMNYVYFSENVGPRTFISGPELDLLGYSLKFEGGTCEVRDKGILVGKGYLVEKKKYVMDYLKIPLDRVPVQVPNVEGVPVPDGPVGPLSVLTPVWTAIRTVWRRFSGSLVKRASEQAPRRPPV